MMRHTLLGAMTCLAVAALACRVRRRYVLVSVRGESMEPTLRHGDRVLADRTRVGGIRVGDVVVLEPGRPRPVPNSRSSTAGPAYWMIKRVVAVPGDPVPPGSVPARHTTPNAVVPWGKLVVAGDNGSASSDSRQLGYFHIEQVLGVVRDEHRASPDSYGGRRRGAAFIAFRASGTGAAS
jgi:signal peptidase I